MSALEKPMSRPEPRREDTAESFDQVILSRFACRDFTDRPVSKRMIEDILEVARFAPSGANIQPWQVHVVAVVSSCGGEMLPRLIPVASPLPSLVSVTM